MVRHWLHVAVRQTFEVSIIFLLVLGFFVAFLQTLNHLFPIGHGLRSDNKSAEIDTPFDLVNRVVSNLLMRRNGSEQELIPTGTYTAIVTRTVNDVRSKKSGAIVWKGAEKGLKLDTGDGVQTGSRSVASLGFDQNAELELIENSLLIIGRLEQDLFMPEKQATLVLARGELRGTVRSRESNTRFVEIGTPAADARVRTRMGAGDVTDFHIRINPDKSSSVIVYNGTAEVMAEGETIKVPENFQANIKFGETPAQPLPLLPATQLRAPQPDQTFYYREVPPRVEFQWSAVTHAEQYAFELASDSAFERTVAATNVPQARFVHGNLKGGDYYWRVTASSTEREGRPGSAGHFRLVQDLIPPLLEIEFPPRITTQQMNIVSGKTEPGAKVFINSERVPVDDQGSFSVTLALKRGVNVIVVEVLDHVDNATFRSETVHAKY